MTLSRHVAFLTASAALGIRFALERQVTDGKASTADFLLGRPQLAHVRSVASSFVFR